ncbi:MAG: hypothetical protein Q4C79_10470 [Neisseria sp.]|uniref:hypothetical protein n=1 Tax=Neisseria sp. TaxID=192066 RepID=UPI0026DD438B|nr:hypothetical protein [Neisseria sp.]MDO4249355.1 hypothetical protein [Neisseria sp.]
MSTTYPLFTQSVFRQLQQQACEHDVAAIAVLPGQSSRWLQDRQRLKAYLEHRRYEVWSLEAGQDVFFVVLNRLHDPAFRTTLVRLGRYVHAPCVLLMEQGGESCYTVCTDMQHGGRIRPVKPDYLGTYFQRVYADGGFNITLTRLAQTQTEHELANGVMGKHALHAQMLALDQELAAVEIAVA